MTEDRASTPQASSRRLLNATAVMASGTLISRVLGFVKATLLVIVLGATTPQADAYQLSTLVPNTLYMIVAGGALNAVLVPQITRHAQNDPDGGEAYINRIMTAFLVLLAAFTVLATVATPLVMSLWTSGSWRAPEMAGHWQQLLLLAVLTMPQLFFYGAFFLIGQVLNARDRFGPMMWAPILNNVVAIGVLGLYVLLWGTNVNRDVPFSNEQVYLLGLGSTLGIIVQTLALIPAMRSIGFRYRARWDLKGTGLGATFHLAKWMLGFVLLTTIVQAIVSKVASGATSVPGEPGAGLATYQTAYLVWILPHSLLTVSLATAMMPSASRLAAAHDIEGVAAETSRTMRLATTFLVPSAVAFLVLGLPFAALAFGHGANTDTWPVIGWTLMAFALGLVPYTIQYVYLRGFYALEDTRTPFFIQLWISVVNVAIAVVISFVVSDPLWVAPALAVAYSVSYAVGAWLTHRSLKLVLSSLSGGSLMQHLARLLLAVLPGAVLAGLLTWWASGQPRLVVLAAFVGAILLAVGSFFVVAKRLGISETTDVLSALRRRRVAPVEDAAGVVAAHAEAEAAPGTEGALLEYPDPRDDRAPAHPAGLTDVPPGEVLNGRFRLDQALSRRGSTVTWRGWDLKLGRAVLIHLMGPDEPGSLEILDRASQAASVGDPRFLLVLDAELNEDGHLGSYIVCEYAPGQSLELALRQGPLTALESAWVVREVAAALVNRHAEGQYHRQLNPDTVVITASGNIKVVGLLIEHALHPGPDDGDPEQTDIRALGELLYACLTGRWPGPSRYGLPAAPTDAHGRPRAPRAVSQRVPVELSDIADRILSPTPHGRSTRLQTAAEIAEALSGLLGGLDASHLLEERLRYPIEHVRITEPKARTTSGSSVVPLAGAGVAVSQDVPIYPDGGPPTQAMAAPYDGSDDELWPEVQQRPDATAGTGGDVAGTGGDPGTGGEPGTGGDAGPDPDTPEDALVESVPHDRPDAPPAADDEGDLLPVDPDAESTGPLETRSDSAPASPWGRPSADEVELDPWPDNEDSTQAFWLDVDDEDEGTAPFTPIPPPKPEFAVSQQAPSQDPPRRWQGFLFAVFSLVLVLGLGGVVVNQYNRMNAVPPAPSEPYTIVAARDFDPSGDGGDDAENPNLVPLAIDGDPATRWTTERYGRSSNFNGRKPGAGIVVDLGEQRQVGWVTVNLGSGPTTGEIRIPVDAEVTEPPMGARDDWRSVASFEPSTSEVRLRLEAPVETRFVLVYLTGLPREDPNFVGGINEISVSR